MEFSDVPNGSNKPLDANRYATKKTIAQGMLDIALLTANASQLKYVLQVGEENHPFYYLMISLISISIILQVMTAITLLVLGPMNLLDINSKFNNIVLNYVAMSLSLGSMFIDIFKMGFVSDISYSSVEKTKAEL
ncbi:ninjurin-2 isoform X7 [Lepeophtheirus salmonis]|uniref:Ninjurin-2 n=1 Tax=Lepeophtheirus salmonis TaxID=72036 RepID=D3PJK8_LEPSM|nr:ninjurin-2-like isoform X6 [Lepeophtheirus salmonis]XP_040567568.1 ninjurin-2-like isoform X6 [Lepeophtheirus salmonis]ADD38744.1 Ninjurin-2 [Lepeophtheirus salmonis]